MRTVTRRFQQSLDGRTHAGIVINDEHRGSVCGRHSDASALVGRLKEKLAPREEFPQPTSGHHVIDDRAADPKSHAGPVRLGSKEGIEDLFRLLRGQPHAAVSDGHDNFPRFPV